MSDDRKSIPLNKGSDRDFIMTWGTTGTLAGATVEVFDAHPAVDGNVAVAVLNEAERTISGRITWADDMPIGVSCYFRVRVTGADGFRTTTPRIYLNIT